MMKLLRFLFLTISLLLQLISAQLTGWPELDVPPPNVTEYTALVNMSMVPNAPKKTNAQATGSTCPAKDPYCYWPCTGCSRKDSDVVLCPSVGDWGLSFDDGPTDYTIPLLDYLDKVKLKITFFIVGSRVVENPDILKRIVNSGHQVGVHTWSHPYLTTQTNEQVIAELQWTAAIIKNVTGVTPLYMRPPYGDYDDRIRSICTQLGYKIVIWDSDTNDWLSDSDKSFQMSWVEGNFTQWVKEKSTTGHISLEHDLYKQTAAQGPLVIPILQNAKFNIKPIADCLGHPGLFYKENPTVANTTSMPTSSPSVATHSPVASSSQDNNSTKTSLAVKNNSHYNYLWSFILEFILITFISFNNL